MRAANNACWALGSLGAVSALAAAVSPDFQQLQLNMIQAIATAKDTATLSARMETMLSHVGADTYASLAIGPDGGVTLATPQVPSGVAIIGGGLAGLTATVRLLDEGHSVTLIDKSSFFGGNSAKASSGINGGYTYRQEENNITDSADTFYHDTITSSKREADSYTGVLARKMCDDSKVGQLTRRLTRRGRVADAHRQRTAGLHR
jgi:hypothetical protein